MHPSTMPVINKRAPPTSISILDPKISEMPFRNFSSSLKPPSASLVSSELLLFCSLTTKNNDKIKLDQRLAINHRSNNKVNNTNRNKRDESSLLVRRTLFGTVLQIDQHCDVQR